MKKSLLTILLASLVLTSCIVPGSKQSSGSSSNDVPSQSGSTSLTTGESRPTSSTTSDGTTGGSSSTSTGTTTGTTSGTTPVIDVQTIAQIKTRNIGDQVCFEATYLKTITWANSNQDFMCFADAHDFIWLRMEYGRYTEYLQKTYEMKEVRVRGILAKVNDVIEVQYDTSLSDRETLIRLTETDPSYPNSYDENTVPVTMANIAEIKAETAQIMRNNKCEGIGKLIKVTSQVVQTEYTDANKKAMLLDSDGNTITVISEKKLVDESAIGKYYSFVGVLSLKLSIPAIMAISCKYVPDSKEGTVDVSKATEVAPSYFSKWNLTTSKIGTGIPNDDCYKLYKSTGYIKDNTSITGSYNLGMVGGFTDKFSSSSSDTCKHFYLVNCVGLNSTGFNNCPVKNYLVPSSAQAEEESSYTKLTIYYMIRQYDASPHMFRMFVIESLIPELDA